MLLGSARFAWTSDYAQIYLIGRGNTNFAAPEDIGAQDLATGCRTLPDAIVIYTADCLRQELRVELHDSAPVGDSGAISGSPWPRQHDTQVAFRSTSFTVSGPSGMGIATKGPWFEIAPGLFNLRLSWCEFPDDRYSISRSMPDEIRVQLWPADPAVNPS
jgi:hypothetical protein